MARGSKRCYYCYKCLGKFGKKHYESTQCPNCHGELREMTNSRVRAQVVTRLARKRGLKPLRKGRLPNRHAEYQKYLHSDLWKMIRGRVLIRDEHTCIDCGGTANQVHHLSYDKEVMEGRDDIKLVSICRQCHDKRHPNKNRKKRRKSAASPSRRLQPTTGN